MTTITGKMIDSLETAMRLITDERIRQQTQEGYTPAQATRPPSVDKQIKDYEIQERVLDQKLGGRIVQ